MIYVTVVGDLVPPEVLDRLSPRDIDAVLANIAEAARNHWIGLAGDGLSGTRRDYLAGIQPVQMAPGVATLALVGVLPNLLENGMAETDLHDTLLGPSVPTVPRGERGKHQKKDGTGFYRYIPFRHAVPTSSGASGTPMGKAYSQHELVADSKKLGRTIHKAAKALSATTTTPGGKTKWGERLKPGMAPKLKPHHHSDIYSGMVRQEKTYKKATQNSYMTFRTISTGSPGWLRGATAGKHYTEEVAAFAATIAPAAFTAYLEGLMPK